MGETGSHAHHHGQSHRESFAIPCGESFLEAHMHDQAATVSMVICPDEGTVMAFADLAAALESIASCVEEAGGIVGHIKAFAREGDFFARASITQAGEKAGCEGDVGRSFGPEADIQLVAIALLLGQEELLAICRQAMA